MSCPPLCQIVDCAKKATRTRSTVCEMHYYRMRRTGSYDLPTREEREARNPRPPRVACAIDGCESWASRRANDLRVCRLHGQRWDRYGRFHRITQSAPSRASRGICTIEDCNNTDDGPHGLCKMHKTRLDRHGDPMTFIAGPERDLPRAADHWSWTGDGASYNALHQRLVKARGPAADRGCADCGKPAKHWSYDHNDANERPSELGPYSIDFEHYAPRCVPCHKRFDLAYLRKSA